MIAGKLKEFFSDKETLRLLFGSFLIGVISNTIDIILNIYLNDYNDENIKIIDLGHNVIPNIRRYMIIFDVLLILIFFCCLFFLSPENRRLYLRCILWGSILRLFFMYSTIMPKHKDCSPTIIKGCYDKIYSGHMGVILLSTLFLQKKIPNLKIPFIILNMMYFIVIIGSRYHYTVDCLVAVYVATTLYLLRHEISVNN